MIGRTCALGLALAAWAAAAAESAPPPRARLAVEPREGAVGDPLAVTLQVWAPEGARVERPEIGAQAGPLTFTFVSWEGPEAAEGGQRWTWKGRIAAFETGTLEVPPFEVPVVLPEGETRARTEPVEIEIRSVLPPEEAAGEGAGLADLKGPASIPPDYRALRRALAVLGALLAISAAAWWLQRRYGPRLAAVPAPPDPFHRLPPHVWVYREMQRLLDRRLPEQGQVDVFFSELARILKIYLGGRYRVDLMERTTAEVPRDLRQAGAPGDAARAAREVLERADRVKFAADRPAPESCREAVERVYRVIDATRPAEEAREAARGAA